MIYGYSFIFFVFCLGIYVILSYFSCSLSDSHHSVPTQLISHLSLHLEYSAPSTREFVTCPFFVAVLVNRWFQWGFFNQVTRLISDSLRRARKKSGKPQCLVGRQTASLTLSLPVAPHWSLLSYSRGTELREAWPVQFGRSMLLPESCSSLQYIDETGCLTSWNQHI
jgi:hypothetical protein